MKKKILLVLGLVVLLGAGGLWFWLDSAYGTFAEPVHVTIERGTGTQGIADALAKSGVIASAWQFLAVRALRPSAKLQAGEYEFKSPMSVREVFDKLARGDVYHFAFTVPEGSNMWDIAKLVEERKIASAADFLKAAQDPSPIRDLDPAAKTLEGYLFPSPYQLSNGTTASQLVQAMTREFRKQWVKFSTKADPHATVVLASLVEKETGVADERPLVASVFSNRLKKPMRLDCDPTVIYAALLAGKYNGVIHRSDLDRQSPYNTYQSDGLPPGPIANPGAAAMEAALHPAESDYLFFVAKPEGGSHVFTATLAAHLKAVQSYRHGAQTQNSAPAKKPKG